MDGKDITNQVVTGTKKPLYYGVTHSLTNCFAENFKRNVIKD
jgi:hypothetical protein